YRGRFGQGDAPAEQVDVLAGGPHVAPVQHGADAGVRRVARTDPTALQQAPDVLDLLVVLPGDGGPDLLQGLVGRPEAERLRQVPADVLDPGDVLVAGADPQQAEGDGRLHLLGRALDRPGQLLPAGRQPLGAGGAERVEEGAAPAPRGGLQASGVV